MLFIQTVSESYFFSILNFWFINVAFHGNIIKSLELHGFFDLILTVGSSSGYIDKFRYSDDHF